MKILFINNDGGGFADHIDVSEGPLWLHSLRNVAQVASRTITSSASTTVSRPRRTRS
jgi:hypothetical protein